MKIVILGHSLAAKRQQLFLEQLSKYADILAIAPKQWGNHIVTPVKKENYNLIVFDVPTDFRNYIFPQAAITEAEKFNPDVIYSITEPFQFQTAQSIMMQRKLKKPLALFSWQNIRLDILGSQAAFMCNLIVCGNKEAVELYQKHGCKTTQCIFPGIDTESFVPLKKVPREYDMIFVGRAVKEKGLEYVEQLQNDYYVHTVENTDYVLMPMQYSSARIQIVPSLTTNYWAEQFPACIAESLACETPCIAFDSGSIKSNYEKCPGVIIVKEGDIKAMKKAISRLLSNDKERPELGKAGRKYVIDNFSNDTVAKRTVEVLKCLTKESMSAMK